MLDRSGICRLIPHAGAMCLLDRVEQWDAEDIWCSSGSHRDPGNPLRGKDGLHAIHAVEYGAQAVAVHGALSGTGLVRARIAALRELRLYAGRLDQISGPLRIHATKLFAAAGGSIYRVGIDSEQGPVAQVQITVMGNPAA